MKKMLARSVRLPVRTKIGILALVLAISLVPLYLSWIRPAQAARKLSEQCFSRSAQALREGDEARVESELLASITAWPKNAAAYSRLGDFYSQQNELALAGTAYVRLLEIDPHYPHTYCRLAQVSSDNNSEDDARRYTEIELKRDPKCLRALDLMSMLAAQHGDYRTAKKYAKQAYDLYPKEPRAIITYAQSLMADDPRLAAKILLGAGKLMPDSWEVAYDLGYSYAHGASDTADVERALVELHRAETLDPQQAAVHRELCRILIQKQQLAEAEKEGALAVKYGPNDSEGYLLYSQVLEREGKKAQAAPIEARFRILDEASTLRNRLRTRYGNFPVDTRTAHQIVEADLKLGLTKEATEVAETALSSHPGDTVLRGDMVRLLKMGISL